ncbi:hypothetical protein R69746_06898 [Paraburkholderia aspalathi]|uniref:toll/interleukin-1 receptor domain-containing protein n=1 Tax=Paraburkholderia aspalathi TaxID=1324617 RepID=UPI00190CAC4C|nr:toll/interleukin-1 receptor domain-containing protein [Paraburkholderia aspalathi]MBK3842911.1 TIR domain-containing protein [Paraburkholderia aspalathi]CAE6840442.1 hypothetical protein R69746_06898 [Paraburkholderia aspalathi]
MSTAPSLFISYSWSNPAHEQWVIDLAERLTHDGVYVTLDKWDLREGHDAHAFMEQMVTKAEIKKVAIIFDKEYARKADDRDRGVGTETRLITGEIYKQSSQEKFVAVIAEKDEEGNPYVPAYYSGRIYIDLANASRIEEEYERLLRWIFDRPLYSRPPIGTAPSFLNDKPVLRLGNTCDLKRVLDHLREGKSAASATLDDYLTGVADAFEGLRIKRENGVEFDQQVVESIESFLSTREDLLSVMRTLARYQPSEDNVTKMQRFFEKLLRYYGPSANVNSYNESDFDNYKFIIQELYLYCITLLLEEERFEQVRFLVETDLYVERNHFFGNEQMVPPSVINCHLESLGYRNQRLKLSRQSLHSDFLNQRNKPSGVPFVSLVQADIVLFLALSKKGLRWWPDTSLFLTSGRVTLPLFARATSRKFFSKIRPVLGGDSIEQFKARISQLHETDSEPRWGYHRLNLASLVGVDALATKD